MHNMKIMKSSWLSDVWEANSDENVLATSTQFQNHKLPTFYKLAITTTGISRNNKKQIEQMVNENGGKYYSDFSGTIINIVIAKKNATKTDKLIAALNGGKDCLCVEWIADSVNQGYALPFENYRIDLQMSKTTSTPTNRANAFDSTTSSIELSNIPYAGKINETALSNMSQLSDVTILNRNKQRNNEDNSLPPHKLLFDKLNVKDAKEAGWILDGCKVSAKILCSTFQNFYQLFPLI